LCVYFNTVGRDENQNKHEDESGMLSINEHLFTICIAGKR